MRQLDISLEIRHLSFLEQRRHLVFLIRRRQLKHQVPKNIFTKKSLFFYCMFTGLDLGRFTYSPLFRGFALLGTKTFQSPWQFKDLAFNFSYRAHPLFHPPSRLDSLDTGCPTKHDNSKTTWKSSLIFEFICDNQSST